MAKTLKDAGPAAHVAEIIYHGDKLILPTGMGIDAAIELLVRRQKFLEEEVSIDETFDAFPWDGANAIDAVLTAKFGWSAATATPGFFGPTPPKLISIAVGPNQFKQVPWGSFTLPGVSGLLETSYAAKNGRYTFKLTSLVRRKDEETIREIFRLTREYLKTNSIYRGQAIKMRFLDDYGDALRMPEPTFLDTSKISEDMVIYSKAVQEQVQTNLFTPIRRVIDCINNNISVKRGVLLGGPFGTGKTLAAHVASKIAVDNGITYLYVPRADELSNAIEFAKQYQSPACVIFCEDIDRAMAGDRTVEMDDILNIIDGIDTKNSNIIVVLTTNALETINPAMLRPGRLDAVINVTPPDAEAVARLIRLYGGDAISADTPLDEASDLLSGQIPAVIAEVVKRAKLAQLQFQKPGEKVSNITEKAITVAAASMSSQIELLRRRSEEEDNKETPKIESALRKIIKEASAEAYADA